MSSRLGYSFLGDDILSSVNFGPVTDIQTEYAVYKRTLHMHRWAKKSVTGQPNLTDASSCDNMYTLCKK